MKKVCAWCNKSMAESEGDDAVVSHGICSDCADNIEFQLGVSIKKFLNSLHEPVLLVDSDCRTISANRTALDMAGKELVAVNHQLMGNVFECAYARLPGGCGKTTHCSGCIIRNAVSETYRTGKSNINISATTEFGSSLDSKGAALKVSTEKVLNFVLLRVEPVKKGQDTGKKQ